jgi:hypothetical protein
MGGTRTPLTCADVSPGRAVWQSSCPCRTGTSRPVGPVIPNGPATHDGPVPTRWEPDRRDERPTPDVVSVVRFLRLSPIRCHAPAVHRRKWLSTSVGGAVFLSGLVMALLPGEPGSSAQQDGGAPTIPDRVAEYSHLTGNVSSSPPGRGIALFQFGFGVEFLDFPQAVVVGADGDVYRRVDLAEDAAGRQSQGDCGPMLRSGAAGAASPSSRRPGGQGTRRIR